MNESGTIPPSTHRSGRWLANEIMNRLVIGYFVHGKKSWTQEKRSLADQSTNEKLWLSVCDDCDFHKNVECLKAQD